jgi:hypothetical protein
MTAGEQLRADLDAELKRESARLGQRLRWDRRELHHIDAACREADHVELLQQRLDAEAADENRASILVKIIAEVPNLDRSIADHLNRVQIGNLLVAKSPQHHAAATARWGVNRPPKRVGA